MREMDYDLLTIQEARELARRGEVAAKALREFTVEQIDKILVKMVEEAEKNAECLAEMAVNETGFGVVKDKLYKNHMASALLYEEIKDKKTIGVIGADPEKQMITYAEPLGLLMGIVPSTNPTSTVIYKSMIALKSRNAIVFSPHPSALKCTLAAVKLMNDAVVAAGGPENAIQGISKPSMEATDALMKAKEIKLIIATGGPAMVKAAYSAGKPAIGVGAGNSPAYIERSADVEKAVRNIIASKTFDNGTICASEQSIIVEHCNRDKVVAELKRQGGYFMTKEETDKVCQLLFRGSHSMNPKFVGRSPQVIADAADIEIPYGTKVLIGEQKGVGDKWPLSYEKLTTVLGFYTVEDWHEACELSIELLQNGIGHTMSLHTEDKKVARNFSIKPASRILINTGGTMGGTGLSTSLSIALTLGCGSWGGSSISENVGPEHLINTKKLVYGLVDCDKLVEKDDLFRKYHPDKCGHAKCEESHNTCSYSEKPVYGRNISLEDDHKTSNPGLAYKLGCKSCSEDFDEEDQALDLTALQTMVDDLVKAMKGE